MASVGTTPTRSPSVSGSGGLKIVLEEGPNLRANPTAAAAFRKAADFIQSLFSDPVTLVVDAEIAPLGPGVIGQSESSEFHFNKDSDFNAVRNLMVKDASPTSESIVSHLPTLSQLNLVLPKPDGGGAYTFSGLTATRAELLALGMPSSNLTAAPASQYNPAVRRDMSLTFSSNFNFDYNRADGISAGKIDFTGVVIHELAHGLGFLSEVDAADYLADLPGFDHSLYPTLLDLFRLRPGAGSANFTTAPRILATGSQEPKQVTFDGSHDLPMSTGQAHGDGQQASHWKDDGLTGVYIGAMDPTASPGKLLNWTANDTRALGLIGWDVAGANSSAAHNASIAGAAFADVNANGTRDSGESGRSGVTVWLDTNGNGRIDTGERTATTDASGNYRFSGLAAGTYNVRSTPPSGATTTAPAGSVYHVTLTTGQDRTGVNFGSAPAVTNLASGWSSRDLGTVTKIGGVSVSGGTVTVRGAGADIFGLRDSGYFYYQSLSGDGEIVARVAGVGNASPFAKAGVMIRQGVNTDSRNAFLAVTRSSGIRFTSRTAAGKTTDSIASTGAAPVWLRLTRSGSTFTAYKSPDGTHWSQIGTRTISMTNPVLIGLAVTAHNAAALNSSVFDHVKITRAAPTTRAAITAAAGNAAPATAESSTTTAAGARAAGGVPWA
ncbi:MAG TPA: NF038122 family metalloprotease [Gemmataceae bacterium]|nr:NF038122 family metalloprotease [Gemmataceae bacterium]